MSKPNEPEPDRILSAEMLQQYLGGRPEKSNCKPAVSLPTFLTEALGIRFVAADASRTMALLPMNFLEPKIPEIREFQTQSEIIERMVGTLTNLKYEPMHGDLYALSDGVEKTRDFGDRFEPLLLIGLNCAGLVREVSWHRIAWNIAISVNGRVSGTRFPDRVYEVWDIQHELTDDFDEEIFERNIRDERAVFLRYLQLQQQAKRPKTNPKNPSKAERKQSPWHRPDESREPGFEFGPLNGNKSELAVWVANRSWDIQNLPRYIKEFLEKNPDRFWGVERSGQDCAIWFREKKRYEQAVKRSETYIKPT